MRLNADPLHFSVASVFLLALKNCPWVSVDVTFIAMSAANDHRCHSAVKNTDVTVHLHVLVLQSECCPH